MIGLDTSVLVRYIMQDDARQSPKATRLLESLDADHPGFITQATIIELYWVLSSCYGLSGEQVAQALEALLRTKQLVVERADQLARALRIFATGKADLADCLIERTCASEGCTRTMTFYAHSVRSSAARVGGVRTDAACFPRFTSSVC